MEHSVFLYHSDRCRTTNNMLGDCYAAAVVQSLSKAELEMMDAEVKVTRTKNTEETEALMTPVTEDAGAVSEDVS